MRGGRFVLAGIGTLYFGICALGECLAGRPWRALGDVIIAAIVVVVCTILAPEPR